MAVVAGKAFEVPVEKFDQLLGFAEGKVAALFQGRGALEVHNRPVRLADARLVHGFGKYHAIFGDDVVHVAKEMGLDRPVWMHIDHVGRPGPVSPIGGLVDDDAVALLAVA